MTEEIVIASDEAGRQDRYLLRVFHEQDHWASELFRLDETGRPDRSGSVAPRFYGVSRDQARRRMISVLENQYDTVETAG